MNTYSTPRPRCTPLDSVTVLRCDCLDVFNEPQMNERLLTAEVKQLMNRPELGKKLPYVSAGYVRDDSRPDTRLPAGPFRRRCGDSGG